MAFLIDIFTYILLVQFWDSVVENCQKICWFDMEFDCVYCKPDFKRCWVTRYAIYVPSLLKLRKISKYQGNTYIEQMTGHPYVFV